MSETVSMADCIRAMRAQADAIRKNVDTLCPNETYYYDNGEDCTGCLYYPEVPVQTSKYQKTEVVCECDVPFCWLRKVRMMPDA